MSWLYCVGDGGGVGGDGCFRSRYYCEGGSVAGGVCVFLLKRGNLAMKWCSG